MNQNNLTIEDFQDEINVLFLIQIIATIISWFNLFISITILYDAYLKFKKKDGLYTEEEVQEIIIVTRTISLVIAIVFLLNTYEGVRVAKALDAYNLNLKVQLIASLITLVPAILTFLVSISTGDELVQTLTPGGELSKEFNPEV